MIIEPARQHADRDVVVLCRYEDQVKEFSAGLPSNVIVPATPVDGVGMLRTTDIFVGMGGTMTIGSDLLGVPTAAIYLGPAEVLTMTFLARRSLIQTARGPTGVLRAVQYSECRAQRARLRRRASRLPPLDGGSRSKGARRD